MYSIDERGKLHPVRLSTSPLEDSRPLSVTHVLDYPLSESLALLVDSFNDTVEVVESDLVSRLRHCQESLPVDVRAYLRSRFSLEGWLPRAKERYAAAVAEQLHELSTGRVLRRRLSSLEFNRPRGPLPRGATIVPAFR